jgi:hypothetical protein
VDPASAAALIGLLSQGGQWAVVVVVLGLVLRVWRSGEFISKAVHDTIVASVKQRYDDLLDRLKNAQEAIIEWRKTAETAVVTAEQAQQRQKEVLSNFAELRMQADALRAALDRLRQEVAELRADMADQGLSPRGDRPNERYDARPNTRTGRGDGG